MALRLVADFDLGKDVLPRLRAQRAEAAGGGAGAGARVGVRAGRAWRRRLREWGHPSRPGAAREGPRGSFLFGSPGRPKAEPGPGGGKGLHRLYPRVSSGRLVPL